MEMPSSPNEAAASETIIPAQTGNTSESTSPNHRKRWRFWSGACFAIVLLAVFAQPLLALSKLRSRERAVFIHFIGTVRFCLPALPSA